MIKKVSRMSEFENVIDELKKGVMKQLTLRMEQLILRPILPRDFGKGNWVWSSSETVTIPAMRSLMINGIYSSYLMQVSILESGTTRMIFANGEPLHEYFILIPENTTITVNSVFTGTEATLDEGRVHEFSITGLVVDPQGNCVAL